VIRSAAAPPSAVIVGAGIGGLALGIRLQSLGVATTILEKLDAVGGRAYARHVDGFTFDMGPTVITVPHFIEELFALEPGAPNLDGPDFPQAVLDAPRITRGESGGPATARYVRLDPVLPFYRIRFHDGTHFDYDGDPAHTRAQIRKLAPGDLAGYERFHADAEAIFKRGFLELGYTHFGDLGSMLRIAPDLARLGAMQPLHDFVAHRMRSEKLRIVFGFEPLLVGGNPLTVPAIYAMIHFVEKTWGVHYARGGTGALVRAFARKFAELGGTLRLNAGVTRIETAPGARKAVRATGVTLASGERIDADLVASNADYVTTYRRFLAHAPLSLPQRLRAAVARESMSIVVIYFGFRADPTTDGSLCHHQIVLGPRYAPLLHDIFRRKRLAPDFSQYLHVPTITDPSLAPPGMHAAYTLVPVPNNASGIDWQREGDPMVDRVLADLETRGVVPNLRARLVHRSFVTPDYYEHVLESARGNGFGLEPIFAQSAFFRPHNRSEDVEHLYLVGQNAQPGGGTPAVMMSAKMTARLIAEDYAMG